MKNLESILAENMRRFNTKNLSEQDGTQMDYSEKMYMNYPHLISSKPPARNNEVVELELAKSSVVTFIKPRSKVSLVSTELIDNKTVYGITGRKWMFSPEIGSNQLVFGNIASGKIETIQAGKFSIFKVNATAGPINDALANEATTNIVKIIYPRLDYAGFAIDFWNILTDSAKVDLSANAYTIPTIMTFVKAGIVAPPTKEQLKMNGYTLLTSIQRS